MVIFWLNRHHNAYQHLNLEGRGYISIRDNPYSSRSNIRLSSQSIPGQIVNNNSKLYPKKKFRNIWVWRPAVIESDVFCEPTSEPMKIIFICCYKLANVSTALVAQWLCMRLLCVSIYIFVRSASIRFRVWVFPM